MRLNVSEYVTWAPLLMATGLALTGQSFNMVAAGELETHAIVKPPSCTNHKGETVAFVERKGGRPGLAAGMAIRNRDGKPVIFRVNFSATPEDFQRFIDRHECAHHQTGDVDRPHPPRNSPAHLLNESISDCIAILRLRDEDGYDQAGFERVIAALKADMAKLGFPASSINSRVRNITGCYKRDGTVGDFIKLILKDRGLLP